MINPFKQAAELKKLRDQANAIQKELAQIEVEAEKGRVKIVMTGDMKVKSVEINGEEMRDAKDAINEAVDKAQKKSAQKMQQMGGGLQELLGGLGK
ncbi:MAG: YbaB/EbfC family nucleoid-associated protein [Candidatus Levybacteria bacterium]|nr:YbaB/EbfC family nucleoid-associated protein [Candidatus Levybacteria bacterium]